LKPPIGQIEKVSIVQQVRQFTKSPHSNLCATHAKSANTARAVSSMSALPPFATVDSGVRFAELFSHWRPSLEGQLSDRNAQPCALISRISSFK
jgi:hypothetical protein